MNTNIFSGLTTGLVFLALLLPQCKGKKEAGSPVETDTTGSIPLANRGIDAEPRLKHTDSIQVLYYDDPDGDSVRYSRYFQYTTSGDTALIRSLLSVFQQPYNELAAPRECRSEGKIYLFASEQEVKTVYFSTRCDSCCYLYFIRDGRFLYVDLNDSARTILSTLKKQSRKP